MLVEVKSFFIWTFGFDACVAPFTREKNVTSEEGQASPWGRGGGCARDAFHNLITNDWRSAVNKFRKTGEDILQMFVSQ